MKFHCTTIRFVTTSVAFARGLRIFHENSSKARIELSSGSRSASNSIKNGKVRNEVASSCSLISALGHTSQQSCPFTCPTAVHRVGRDRGNNRKDIERVWFYQTERDEPRIMFRTRKSCSASLLEFCTKRT